MSLLCTQSSFDPSPSGRFTVHHVYREGRVRDGHDEHGYLVQHPHVYTVRDFAGHPVSTLEMEDFPKEHVTSHSFL